MLVLLQALINLPNIIAFCRKKMEEWEYDRKVRYMHTVCELEGPLFEAYERKYNWRK